MGNDNSKSTIENQQLILQLQHQILNNNSDSNNINIQNHLQHTKNTLNTQHTRHTQEYTKNTFNKSNNVLLYDTKPLTVFDILNNKKIMDEVDKNPKTKCKLLDKILNEHKHIMTSTQVIHITQLLAKTRLQCNNIDYISNNDNDYNENNGNVIDIDDE